VLQQAPKTLTRAQVDAIRRAMKTFVEEDIAFGERCTSHRRCARCVQERPGAGFVDYDGGSLCNECAITYEVARATGAARSVAHFLSAPPL
jgi:hypothetical protein